MISYTWKILEVFSNGEIIDKVRYLLTAKEESNVIETEGYYCFPEGIVSKSYSETKEEDLIRWLEKDTVQDDVKAIKLSLENQLKALKNSKKVDFPWENDTFTIE
jgi:hypothetical protein